MVCKKEMEVGRELTVGLIHATSRKGRGRLDLQDARCIERFPPRARGHGGSRAGNFAREQRLTGSRGRDKVGQLPPRPRADGRRAVHGWNFFSLFFLSLFGGRQITDPTVRPTASCCHWNLSFVD